MSFKIIICFIFILNQLNIFEYIEYMIEYILN